MKKEVGPDTSALILLGRANAKRRARVTERLDPFKRKVIESEMPDDVEREVTRVLAHDQMAPPDA